jgi:HAD superfamily hydrolase (TIGR01509 family)
MDFELIIFDCDGVLVDSELLSCRCLSAALGTLGIEAGVEVILDRFLGQSVETILGHYRGLGWRFSPDFTDDLALRTRQEFARSLRPIAGIEAALRSLRTRTCVASSSDRARVVHSLALTGLDRLFGERIYTAQMVRHGKPAPDLFLHAASAMGAAPGRTLVVEDSVSGVTAGKAACMTVWGFTGGSHYAGRDGKPGLLAAGADLVFEQMADFPALAARDGVGR